MAVCIQRDVKGLYKKALKGELTQFTGISDPYEPPPCPEVVVDSSQETPEDCVNAIVGKLEELGYVTRESTKMFTLFDSNTVAAPAYGPIGIA